MIEIAVSSDFHGCLPEVTKPFDLMLLAGDLEPARYHNYSYQKAWYQEEFLPWVEKLPFKNTWSKLVFTSGNHSVYLAQEGNSCSVYQNLFMPSGGRVIYLHNESFIFEYLDNDEIKSLSIFGTPYCKIFGNWWNMLSDESLTEEYSLMPENVDILLSHDCPYGVCDMCYGWIDQGRQPQHIGNKPLRNAIIEKHPKYNFCGHLHSANHDWEVLDKTLVRQVSLLNESYIETYPIFYFNY